MMTGEYDYNDHSAPYKSRQYYIHSLFAEEGTLMQVLDFILAM